MSSTRDIGTTVTSSTITTVNNAKNTASIKLGVPVSLIKPVETVPHVIKSHQNHTSGGTSNHFPGGGKNTVPAMGLALVLVILLHSTHPVWQEEEMDIVEMAE